jgi:small subunit ribosomal protein S21
LELRDLRDFKSSGVFISLPVANERKRGVRLFWAGKNTEIAVLDIKVHGNDVEKALKLLKRQLQKEGLFREVKQRSFYEKPSVKEKRKRREAMRKRLKAQRFKRKNGA